MYGTGIGAGIGVTDDSFYMIGGYPVSEPSLLLSKLDSLGDMQSVFFKMQ